jgi:hypothetical protein
VEGTYGLLWDPGTVHGDWDLAEEDTNSGRPALEVFEGIVPHSSHRLGWGHPEADIEDVEAP